MFLGFVVCGIDVCVDVDVDMDILGWLVEWWVGGWVGLCQFGGDWCNGAWLC